MYSKLLRYQESVTPNEVNLSSVHYVPPIYVILTSEYLVD